MASEIKRSIPVGKTVTNTTKFFGFQLASSTNLIFHPAYQQVLNRLQKRLKLYDSAFEVEIEKIQILEKKILGYKKSIESLNSQHSALSNESRRLNKDLKKTNNQWQKLQKEKDSLEKMNTHLTQTNQKNTIQKTQILNENQFLQREIDAKAASLKKVEVKTQVLEKQNQTLENQLETIKSETEQKIQSMEQQSSNNEKYLQQVYSLRHSPAALQLLQKRINAPLTTMNPDDSIYSLPIPCLQETVQQTHQSVATMKVSAAIFSKENGPASRSQDACSFGEVEGRLTFAVADGVSTSNRQSEWAKRLVTACIGPEDIRDSRFKKAQSKHKIDGEKLTTLIDDNVAWVWEEKLAEQSDATLLTGHITPEGNARLHRRGDTWAATKKKNGRKWNIILPPSTVNGTHAVNSHSPLEFDESIDISDVSKLLIMTDGVASTDSKFLDELWSKVTGNDPGQLEYLVEEGRQENTFDNDDITIVAIDTRGFRHN
jgi:myosin heavy subunit